MQPIFKEMIQMWNDLGYPLPIEEGKYWLENHFVCGFTADGELHKLYKYKVADDLSIEITPYKMNKIKLSLFFNTDMTLFIIIFVNPPQCAIFIHKSVIIKLCSINCIYYICVFVNI